jgi:hypothetical protein
MEEYEPTPLKGKRVVIVCDDNTLKALFDMRDDQWINYVPGEFFHIVQEIQEVTLTADQALHQERMTRVFISSFK